MLYHEFFSWMVDTRCNETTVNNLEDEYLRSMEELTKIFQ